MPRKDLETSALSYRKHPGMLHGYSTGLQVFYLFSTLSPTC